ncbi:hypothetical protein RMN56_29265 [Micromonospora halotolerans]|uniref:Uncharacterized protein n=1 Tax=Micromonospora halotolerans TaxID=709879 RepID=A0ABY9ZVF1_9ACTN|nr:hypothetical protein [Micromonospora halotolerans]WNM39164.1 hypothetical protein RMN56_29265 [Micromonospora halotolerans]
MAEIGADVAFKHARWRVRYAQARRDMSVYDVPLLLGEEEGYFGEPHPGRVNVRNERIMRMLGVFRLLRSPP